MKVPFRLRRLSAGEPAIAFLLPSQEVGQLLDLCARIGSSPLPSIHLVADGFLLKLSRPVGEPLPGTIRLRALAENLLLPADAELVPALQDDEARGLVRDRGIVFLPGGHVLGFAPDKPLPLSALLTAGRPSRRQWQPFPILKLPAERITRLTMELPADPPDVILEAGSEQIGTESPRPEDSNLAGKVLGKGSVLAGKGIMHLGRLPGLGWLAGLGARLVESGLALAPRLSEALLGRQEAALRALLREFREGNLERALRQALPLLGPADRGAVPATDFRLPFHNLLYSLRNILGAGNRRGAMWFGGGDVQADLAAEYRKAAEAAAARGDYRRAAFIYGKLLQDYRSAANVLLQGGLCHDAAVIFLTKVGDTPAAARAFEAAGEIDRAVQLYHQCGEHVSAGDLLLRSGEGEAALIEYQMAADRLVASGNDYLAAGELLLRKAQRPDLALAYFEEGWARRPGANEIPCALHLSRAYAGRDSPEALLRLVAEAEEFLRPAGNDTAASQFFNEVGRLAERQNLAPVRDDLRDRALLGLAAKLRQRAGVETRPGNLISAMLGQSHAWEPAVVSDADFALRAAVKQSLPQIAPGITTIQIAPGLVSSVCAAAHAGDVFLGFANGAVFGFRAARREVVRLPSPSTAPITSLAADPDGRLVVALQQDGTAPRLTSCALAPQGGYRIVGHAEFKGGYCRLAPFLARAFSQSVLAIWDEHRLRCLLARHLVHWGELTGPPGGVHLSGALLLPAAQRSEPATGVLLFGLGQVWYGEDLQRKHGHWAPRLWRGASLGWTPGIPEESPLTSPPLSMLRRDKEHLELAGLGANGTVHWSLLQFNEDGIKRVATNVSAEGYLATTLIRPGLVAAVSAPHIDWLRGGGKKFSFWSRTTPPLPAAVACFPSPAVGELIVVCRDGVVVCVPVPH